MSSTLRRPLRRSAILMTVAAAGAAALAAGGSQTPYDAGASGALQKLRKLGTIASAMHITAHPDDEHGGVLAFLSRGRGARVSMLTLTRGESGDNAIGPELFDALGLLRTGELLAADRYYGVDRQYFGTVVDYGFSKRLDEALQKWGKEYVLRDVVAVLRTERPLVLISRFQGNARDGHGNHSAAGLVAREAFSLAGDPTAFPEQIAAGLRPWQPLKLYMGGVRENEPWTIRIDSGEYDPVLGDSYQSLARLGLAFQRSQNSGTPRPQPGPSYSYYQRLQSVVDAPAREQSFFDGIDVTIPGLYRALRKTPSAGADRLLAAIDREIAGAVAAFTLADPSASVPALARALAATRTASKALAGDGDVVHVLNLKEEQIEDAINAVLGTELTATGQPSGTKSPAGPFGGAAITMGPVVPGQRFDIHTVFVSRAPAKVSGVRLSIEAAESGPRSGHWHVSGDTSAFDAAANQPVSRTFTATVPLDAAVTRPHFSRESIQEARYNVSDEASRYQPWTDAVLHAVARYDVEGVPVTLGVPVTRLEADLPYGYNRRVLAVVPALAVTLSPSRIVAPAGDPERPIRLRVEVVNNQDGDAEALLALDVPEGWRVQPASLPLRFSRAGERSLHTFEVIAPALGGSERRIQAVATSRGRAYREGYAIIRHRDLETRYLYRTAAASVRGIDVTIRPGLKVGYVMGVGDDVPAGLAQLGVEVQLLGQQELATADMSRFDAIVTGTRAYAVREDLKTYNRRLLDYVQNGGNMIVLYNTQEFVPNLYAPYPAELPGSAEEVSEEDSPVEILARDDPVLQQPNRITNADFDGWVEQRGSKYWTTWDSRYTPIIATWDTGQAPQKGGWLHARYGKGHYTYFAYALHRQLPYGVPGAYRIVANLLSLSQPRR